MAKTTTNGTDNSPGIPAELLVAVGADAGELDLSNLSSLLLAPLPVPLAEPVALGDILADAVFGDEVDISDLLPGILDGDSGLVAVAVADGAGMDPAGTSGDLIDLGGLFATTSPLAALFDDDTNGHTAL